jgi:hypothetical protein
MSGSCLTLDSMQRIPQREELDALVKRNIERLERIKYRRWIVYVFDRETHRWTGIFSQSFDKRAEIYYMRACANDDNGAVALANPMGEIVAAQCSDIPIEAPAPAIRLRELRDEYARGNLWSDFDRVSRDMVHAPMNLPGGAR